QTSVEFLRDVEPIFHKNCYACHGPSQQMNGLRFDQKEAAFKGGYSGPAFVPGNSAESKLIQKVASSKDGFKMPPAGPALSPQEVNDFLADSRPNAYEQLIDRLLDSPHYGEKWARQWLDLARYADSDGYEKDQPRPYAWRWRHWVIEALNRDMPFDEFTREQMAGDLLAKSSPEPMIATGFHRNGLKK